MKQATLTNWDKAAILLSKLTPAPNQAVLGQLEPAQAAKLKKLIEDIGKRPDLEQVTQAVLSEFHERRTHSGAAKSPSQEAPHFAATSNWAARQYSESAEQATSSDSAAPAISAASTTAARVSKIAPPTLARVLQAESPRVLVLVLQAMESDQAAAVIKLLPPEGRGSAVTMLAAGLKVAESVNECVLKTVLVQAGAVGPVRETIPDDEVQIKRLVGILQEVDREERMRLMSVLSEQNEAVAAKIDDCLYDYSDLLRIGDRSLQKILTQTDQKTLAMALKTAPEEIRDKVMKNMSERVRAALAEEMEFLSEVPNAKAEAARKDITAIIRTQDKEGALVWLEQ